MGWPIKEGVRHLVVGLGNSPFPLTRHSVGHMAVDYLVEKWKLKWENYTGQGYLARVSTGTNTEIGKEGELFLFKPFSLMNLSGVPVSNMGKNRAFHG
jgi:peptidyl-tRNA hydrolase, PTH1 family